MSEFGDWEPDDTFCAEGEPAPEQVSYRFHEFRQHLAELGGSHLDDWAELEPEDQQIALLIGQWLVEQIAATPNADWLALWLNEVRAYIDSDVPAWNELDEDEQQIAVGLMELLVDWLMREG